MNLQRKTWALIIKFNLNKSTTIKKPSKSFKLSKPFSLKLSLNKKRCCQRSNQNKPPGRVIVNISYKQTRRSFFGMIGKRLVIKLLSIISKVQDKDKQRKLGCTVGEDGWRDNLEIWRIFSVGRGNNCKANSNRPEGGAKVMAKVMKSMKKVRRIDIDAKE